jgi:hypothetical protein
MPAASKPVQAASKPLPTASKPQPAVPVQPQPESSNSEDESEDEHAASAHHPSSSKPSLGPALAPSPSKKQEALLTTMKVSEDVQPKAPKSNKGSSAAGSRQEPAAVPATTSKGEKEKVHAEVKEQRASKKSPAVEVKTAAFLLDDDEPEETVQV